MIEMKDLEVCYGEERALNQLSLSIARNTTCAVIGASGCGKTTLLYALAGMLKPKTGSIHINGADLNGIRKNTSLILQDYGLLPWKNVWDNIAFPLTSRGLTKGEIHAKTYSILKSLGLEDHLKKYPCELSGGQKQRVGIGRALALEPDLLLMDEASSALDSITKEHIQNLVLKIYRENKLTLVLVTHNIEEAVYLGQRIVVMGKGDIKHIIENPYFGLEDARNSLNFYKICLEVRKWLTDEAYHAEA